MKHILHIFLFLIPFVFQAQTGTITGVVKSTTGEVIPLTKITVKTNDKSFKITSNNDGMYSVTVPSYEEIKITFEAYFYSKRTIKVEVENGEEITKNIFLKPSGVEKVVTRDEPNLIELPVLTHQIPSPSGNFEDLLKTQAGVSSTNELSSGYNVRGGNFDENLVYVNDIEIYRPFLARSGQQEGLSFINSSLVESIRFSAGGFDAKYGDKLSSVLDITYKRPYRNGGSISGSLMGGTAHYEGISGNARFTHLTGVRYRSNGYLLNGLGTKGEYRPVFSDIQTYLTYNITDLWQISFLGSFSKNKYRVVPETRESNFGPINQALRLKVFFDGQEISQFETYTGAFTSSYKPNPNLELKFITSIFRTFEEENYDIQGEYFLDAVENDPSSDEFGETKFNLGVGSFLRHARNSLDATVGNFTHKGYLTLKNNDQLLWGAKAQYEQINDKIREWEVTDSSRYFIPHYADSIGFTDPLAQPYQNIELNSLVGAKNSIESSRFTGFVQYVKHMYKDKDINIFDTIITSTRKIDFAAGVRSHYWTYNNQNVISPRASITLKPRWYYMSEDSIITRRDFNFRLSTGLYYQPPFYREFRNFEGELNPSIRAQKSIHFVLGADYVFEMWNRPFKYTAEVYYKHLDDIIPYEIDNVRIRYYADNNATGFATGLDMKINGEFIDGVESWFTASFMTTQEDISNDFYNIYLNSNGDTISKNYTFDFDNVLADSIRVEPGFIPRPTDQRFNFGIFFQDHMPSQWNTEKINWESFKVYLALQFGGKLPFGPPTQERYKDVLRTPFYRRVDIGFSKEFLVNRGRLSENSFWHNVKSLAATFEVFNLLDIKNTSSYTWIKDASNLNYAIPNHLTTRRLNLKITATF